MAADETTWSARDLLGVAADRLGVAPTTVGIGILAVLAAAMGGWWALRTPDPPPVETMIPLVAETPIPSAITSTTTAAPLVLFIDVGGAVARPGVHQVRDGDRVVDAIRAAGGLTPDADRSRLNMAMPVADGQRLWVPVVGEVDPDVVPLEGGASVGSGSTVGGLIDINSADSSALETLPGIGPSLAEAIIAHRTREGAFRRVEDLVGVPGIGRAKLQQLAPLVTV